MGGEPPALVNATLQEAVRSLTGEVRLGCALRCTRVVGQPAAGAGAASARAEVA